MSQFNVGDWLKVIPCNDEYEVPLLCRPNFKDLVTLSGGLITPKFASEPTGYQAAIGSLYYNTVDGTLYYRNGTGFQALGVSGTPAPPIFPLAAESASGAEQLLLSTLTPDGDTTYELLADGTHQYYNGAGVLLGQLRYDEASDELTWEDTGGSKNGTFRIKDLKVETITCTEGSNTLNFNNCDLFAISDITAGTGTFNTVTSNLQVTTTRLYYGSNLTIDPVGDLNITPGGQVYFGSQINATTGAITNITSTAISAATLVGTTSLSTPSITTTGSGITLNSKNLTNVATLSAANVDAVSGNLNINATGGNIIFNPATTGSTIGNNLRGTIGNSSTGLCPVYSIDNLVITGVTGTGTISVASIVIPAGTLTTNGDYISLKIYGHTPLSTTGNQLNVRLGTAAANFINLVDSSNGTYCVEFIFKFLTTTSWRQMAIGSHGTAVITGGAPTTQSTTVDFTTATTLEIRAVQGTSASIQISAGSLQLIKPSVL